jgi:hypothetical protein
MEGTGESDVRGSIGVHNFFSFWGVKVVEAPCFSVASVPLW